MFRTIDDEAHWHEDEPYLNPRGDAWLFWALLVTQSLYFEAKDNGPTGTTKAMPSTKT
jgi:hypothetical protein